MSARSLAGGAASALDARPAAARNEKRLRRVMVCLDIRVIPSDPRWSDEFVFSCTDAGRIRAVSAAGDAQQLYLEMQRCVGRDRAAGAALAVGDAGRAGEPGLAAYFQLLHAFGPALDHAVERKLGRLAARIGAVELLAVGKGAAVVHAHLVAGLRARAAAFLERAEHQPR